MATKLGDYTFEDFGLIEEFGHVHPSIPEISENTLAIPGRRGLLSFGTNVGAKHFSFPVKVFVSDRYERQRSKNKLVAFLFDEYMQPREFKLVFDYEPDKYYIAKISNQITPEMLFQMDQFDVSLVANDPTKYFLVDADEIRMGSHIPVRSHVRPARHSFVITNNQTVKLMNDGNLAIRPRISISGTATSLTVRNTKNNKTFKMTNIIATKPIIIEGNTYMVTEGGVDTFSKLLGDFIDLIPGENNISITGEGINLDISFKYRTEFM
ncbi:phage tail family protein [Niallia taxi]|uniref:distal tail protein Dit n=1 Tax=Niallia taxi TaxID=2499688 RepID=UPI002E2322F5|nr:distal tail protein Dit [Niallia taxi]MED4052933.1 phage tail family protein [Niallia taxi]MED4118073.1 phage tail family protein [Niallia taxi]